MVRHNGGKPLPWLCAVPHSQCTRICAAGSAERGAGRAQREGAEESEGKVLQAWRAAKKEHDTQEARNKRGQRRQALEMTKRRIQERIAQQAKRHAEEMAEL